MLSHPAHPNPSPPKPPPPPPKQQTSNVNTAKEPLLQGLIKKYIVKTIGGYKVALVGWLTPETSYSAANPGNVTFDPVVPAVKKCIQELKKEVPDVHMIIGMSHTGGCAGGGGAALGCRREGDLGGGGR